MIDNGSGATWIASTTPDRAASVASCNAPIQRSNLLLQEMCLSETLRVKEDKRSEGQFESNLSQGAWDSRLTLIPAVLTS